MSRCFGNHVALSLLAISLKKSGSSGITRTRILVPEMSGFYYSVQILGNNYQNPKFQKLEKPDPKFSGYPNAHP
jgi:hypothetical protein